MHSHYSDRREMEDDWGPRGAVFPSRANCQLQVGPGVKNSARFCKLAGPEEGMQFIVGTIAKAGDEGDRGERSIFLITSGSFSTRRLGSPSLFPSSFRWGRFSSFRFRQRRNGFPSLVKRALSPAPVTRAASFQPLCPRLVALPRVRLAGRSLCSAINNRTTDGERERAGNTAAKNETGTFIYRSRPSLERDGSLNGRAAHSPAGRKDR